MVWSHFNLVAFSSVIALLTACGSTPERRIEENQSLFDTYPADVQVAIRSGQIRKGFNQNQVYMALDKPAQKDAGATGETWIYTNKDSKHVTTKKDVYKYELERKNYEEKKDRGEYAMKPSMEETLTYYRTRVVRVVDFTKDRVSGWSTPSAEFLDEWHLES